MTTTSSFKSCSVLDGVLLMAISLRCCLCGEFLEGLSKDAVERGKRVDHVGQHLQWSPELNRQHELAEDLACPRCDQRRADQHAALAVADQFERASMEVMNVAARGFGGIG